MSSGTSASRVGTFTLTSAITILKGDNIQRISLLVVSGSAIITGDMLFQNSAAGVPIPSGPVTFPSGTPWSFPGYPGAPIDNLTIDPNGGTIIITMQQ